MSLQKKIFFSDGVIGVPISKKHAKDIVRSVCRSDLSTLKNIPKKTNIKKCQKWISEKQNSKAWVYCLYFEKAFVGVLEIRDKNSRYSHGCWIDSNFRKIGIYLKVIYPEVLKILKVRGIGHLYFLDLKIIQQIKAW